MNTPEIDTAAKAKTDTAGLKPGAFVCLDVRESDNYYGCTINELIKVVPPLLLSRGCLIIVGNNQQV